MIAVFVVIVDVFLCLQRSSNFFNAHPGNKRRLHLLLLIVFTYRVRTVLIIRPVRYDGLIFIRPVKQNKNRIKQKINDERSIYHLRIIDPNDVNHKRHPDGRQ